MAVKNGGEYLSATIESVTSQTFENFEFIIVDDGSRDHTSEVLNDFATRDCRIKLFERPAQGLTKSLIFACEQASGRFIARQDSGDLSQPSRFESQIGFLKLNEDCVAVHSNVQTISPEGVSLFVNNINESQLESSLLSSDVSILEAPPHHGAAMMRAESYFKVGGYRPEFYFAQDLDLWVRLARLGKHGVLDDCLYHSRLQPDSISGQFTDYQNRLKAIIAKMNASYGDEDRQLELLQQAGSVRPDKNNAPGNLRKSKANYFIGSCLQSKNPRLARKYFLQSLKFNPFQLKALYKIFVNVN